MIEKSYFKVTTSIGTISLFSVAIPLIFETITNNLIGTINTVVLSSYSQAAVTAVAAANSLLSTFSLFFVVISLGATVVISNYIGAEELKSAEEASLITIIMYILIGLGGSVCLYIFRYPLISMMNVTGSILEEAVCYFEIRGSMFAILACSSALTALLRCYGHAGSTVIGGAVVSILNLLFSVFVIRFAHYSPVTGVKGVAWASVMSQSVGLLIYFCLFVRFKMKLRFVENVQALKKHVLKILKIGIPSGISSASLAISQTITTSFVALLGMEMLNAKVYLNTILNYVYIFSVSLGSANSLLVGRLYGARQFEQADKANKQLVKITMFLNLFLSISVLFLRKPLLSLFTDQEEILGIALGIMLIDIITEQGRAVSHVYEYSLRAVGDVLFTVVSVIVLGWGFSIGLAYYLGIYHKLGLLGFWIGLALDEGIKGVLTWKRWNYLRRKEYARC